MSVWGVGSSGSFRAGAGLCCPNRPAMAEEAVIYREMEDMTTGWRGHFSASMFKFKGKDLPQPCMWKGVPCWRGGLRAMAREEEGYTADEEMEWISNFKLSHKLVRASEIKLPTEKEYALFFRKSIEAGYFRIKVSHKNGTAMVVVDHTMRGAQ